MKFSKTLPRHIASPLALSLIVGLVFGLSACNKKPIEPTAKVVAPAAVATPAPAATAAPQAKPADTAVAPLFAEFDWSKIQESSAQIGAFPYISAPEGFVIYDEGRGATSKTGYTKLQDFSKLIMYNGQSFSNAEGKVAIMSFGMKEKGEFGQYKFDKSIDQYLESLGATLLFKGQIPKEKISELRKSDEMIVHKYIVGDPYNSDPVRHYALNHKNGKIMLQVWSNSASAEVGVVQLEGFKQTIQAPTAASMKKDIDATGKAVLNINFDTDKATLKADGQTIVNQITALMKNNAGLKLSIEGHTDNTGSAEHNKKLSADRANTVMLALVSDGINKSDLKSAGYGADKPMVANDTADNKAKNRRVELVKF